MLSDPPGTLPLTSVIASGIIAIMEIKKIRDRLGMSQEEFAHRVGVSFTTVNRWERGKSKPSPMAQASIRQLLGENRRLENLR